MLFERVAERSASAPADFRHRHSAAHDQHFGEVVAERGVIRVGGHLHVRTHLHVVRDHRQLGRFDRLVIERAVALEENADRFVARHHPRDGAGGQAELHVPDSPRGVVDGGRFRSELEIVDRGDEIGQRRGGKERNGQTENERCEKEP